MSLEQQKKAKAAIHSFLDFMGDYFVKEPLPEEEMIKAMPAHVIHTWLIVSMNMRGKEMQEQFGSMDDFDSKRDALDTAWRDALDILLEQAKEDFEAHLSCVRLIELFNQDQIPLPTNLADYNSKTLRRAKLPSAKSDRAEGAVTRDGVIYACMNIAKQYVGSLYSESSRAATAAEIVRDCLDERRILNTKGKSYKAGSLKKSYQRNKGRNSYLDGLIEKHEGQEKPLNVSPH